MAASRPLPLDNSDTQKALSGDANLEQNEARIIHLSDYFMKLGSQFTHRHAQQQAVKGHETHKLQAKAVRFFQGQQELNLTNKV